MFSKEVSTIKVRVPSINLSFKFRPVLALGLSCFWLSYFLIMVGAARLADRSVFEFAGSSPIFAAAFVLSLFATSLITGYCKLKKHCDKSRKYLPALLATKCLFTFIACILILSQPSTIISVFDLIVGMFLGASTSFTFMLWAELYSEESSINVAFNAAIALTFSILVYVLVIAMGEIHLLLLLSVIACLTEALLCWTDYSKRSTFADNEKRLQPRSAEPQLKIAGILQIALVFMLLGFTSDNLRQLAFSSFNLSNSLFDFAVIIISATLVCGLILIALFGFSKSNQHLLSYTALVILPIVAACIVFLYYFNTTSWSAYYSVAFISYTTLEVYIWVLLCNTAANNKNHRAIIIGVSTGFLFFARILTSFVNNFALTSTDHLSIENVGEPIIILFCLTIALVLLNSGSVFKQGESASQVTEKPIKAKIAAARFSLTQREEEVLELLLEGRTYSSISDMLYISLNTTKSHSKNIYSKMGVHSKQELIDLLDDIALPSTDEPASESVNRV